MISVSRSSRTTRSRGGRVSAGIFPSVGVRNFCIREVGRMRSTTPALRGSFLGEFVSFRPEGGRRSFSGRDRSARRGCSDYSLISSVPFPSLIRLLRFLVFRRGLDNGRGGGGRNQWVCAEKGLKGYAPLFHHRATPPVSRRPRRAPGLLLFLLTLFPSRVSAPGETRRFFCSCFGAF